jgi:hypothetical protein
MLADLFSRALDSKGAAYKPYEIVGAFTDEERAQIEAAFAPHVPQAVDAMYNHWEVEHTASGYIMVMRYTWSRPWGMWTVDDVVSRVTEYFSK